MDESQDIVYLETRLHRWKGRWQAMDRVPRLGIVSTIFGGIGLLTSFFLKFIPFLSLPFSLIGLLIGAVSFLIGFYQNRRRDGFWFPLTGLILSLMGLAIGLANWNSYEKSQQQKQQDALLQAAAEEQARLVGRWLKGEGPNQQTLEMTKAGSLLWSDTGNGNSVEETVARYKFKDSILAISFPGTDGGTATVRYSVDTTQENQLLLGDRRVVHGVLTTDMSGRWDRVGPPRKLTAAEKDIADYQGKCDRFREQREKVLGLIERFENERLELLQRLEPYRNGQPKDDRWNVWAQELNNLINQINVLERRLPQLDQAIVRLDTAIATLTRQAQLDQVGLDTAQLEELLLTTDRLDDELKSLEVDRTVEQFILDQVVEQELEKGRNAADPGDNQPH